MTDWLPQPLAAVWFDLDGTLVDSAPDLYAAASEVCAEQGVRPPDEAHFRSLVSQGGTTMLRACFPGLDEARQAPLLARFLERYAARKDRETHLFAGLEAVLAGLESQGIPWGVVTNKAAALAEPLLRHLGLHQRAVACVYGDSLPTRKPQPEPLLHVCRVAGVAPGDCLYVGDDLRDVQAAHAAGMPCVAAGWGYLGGGDPAGWGAEAVLADVATLATLLDET